MFKRNVVIRNYSMGYLRKLIVVINLLVIIFSQFSCKTKNDAISPEVKDITESVYASGVLKSKNQYEVFTKYNGTLEKIFVKEGMKVKKGTALFKIENKSTLYNTSNARLVSTANDYILNNKRLSAANNTIELAKKKLLNDSLLYAKQMHLWDNKIGSQFELEQKELSYENSKNALTQALVNYEDLNRQLKLASGQSKNNLQMAELTENDFVIRSEVDGVVYKINKQQGELVSSLTPLAVVGEDNFIIELNIDEFDIVKVRQGQQLIIRMDSYKSQVYEANISTIYPMMNERTRTFKAEAEFSKRPEMLFLNLTLEANIIIKTKNSALTIPRNCLINDSLVMLENGSLQTVKTGLMDYKIVEIIDGISSSTKIIPLNK